MSNHITFVHFSSILNSRAYLETGRYDNGWKPVTFLYKDDEERKSYYRWFYDKVLKVEGNSTYVAFIITSDQQKDFVSFLKWLDCVYTFEQVHKSPNFTNVNYFAGNNLSFIIYKVSAK